jgi:hypothetical protein
VLSPVQVDFDPSNHSWNIFVIEVLRITREMAEDPGESWELQPFWFPTLGKAMSFLQPQIERPLTQEKPGSAWVGDLKANSPLGRTQVRITQLVLVNE